MKTIEINTSFNVIIKFNLANVFERGAAYLIDLLIIWAIVGFISLFAYQIASSPSPYLFLYFAAPLMFFYTIVSEVFSNGQTIGKKALKIQVVRIDGKRTKPIDFMMRWIFRLLDIYSSGGILGVIVITASPQSQRLGDILANTCLIKIKEVPETSLIFLNKLNELQKQQPVYTEVKNLTESDLMLVKEALSRYEQFPNQAHKEAISELVHRIESELQIKCTTAPKEFLKQLIKDFVILTR